MNTDNRKQAILSALRAFIAQRPGMDPREYGDYASYRSESRQVTRDRHDAERLLREVELHDSISADAILKEADGGGRLTLETEPVWNKGTAMPESYTCGCGLYVHPSRRKPEAIHISDCKHDKPYAAVSYCTGQYFPTEYRKAVARLMASVLWTWTREQCMPGAGNTVTGQYGIEYRMAGTNEYVSAGDWLRAHFRREFGKTLAERYFS